MKNIRTPLIGLSLFLFSCTTVFKSNQKEGTFLKDSDFLKQKYEIQQKKVQESKVKEPLQTQKLIKIDSRHKVKNQKEDKKSIKKSISKIKHKKNIKPKKEEIKQPQKQVKKEINLKELFPVGEQVVLSASFFGVEAGKVQLGVKSDKLFNGKEVLHFYALGKTSSLFSLVYKVRDSIESLWSLDFKRPLSLAFDVDETKQKYKTRSYFDWSKRKAEYFEEGWHKKKGNYRNKKEWKLPKFGQDILSVIFYIRTLDLEVGKEYNFNVMEDEKVIQAQLKVDRREILKTKIGALSALVLKPFFKTKGKFKKVGDISIWVTDDKYKQLLRVESKIKIGTVTAKVESIVRPDTRL